jgi:hypothetical protein
MAQGIFEDLQKPSIENSALRRTLSVSAKGDSSDPKTTILKPDSEM